MKKTIVLAAVAASIAGGAYAGSAEPVAVVEAVIAAEPASESVDWSGFYVGGISSSDSGTGDYYVNNVAHNLDHLFEGSMVGAFAGYNFQRGSLVFGGELAYSAGNIDLTTAPSYTTTSFIDAKVRAGYDMGNAMAYGVVGASIGSYDRSGLETVATQAVLYGIGIDMMATNHIFVGIEFLMRDDVTDNSGINPTDHWERNFESLQLRAGYKF